MQTPPPSFTFSLQVESIQQEFENFMSQGVHHPRLAQFLDMSSSKPHGPLGNKFSVEVSQPVKLANQQSAHLCALSLSLCVCLLVVSVWLQLVMEYVGGGNVSSYLRNPDSGPVGGSVSQESVLHYVHLTTKS